MSTRLMARSLAAVFIAGASLTLVWVSLPHGGSSRGDWWIRFAAIVGLAAAAGLLSGAGDRVPRRWVHLVIAFIQVFVTVAYVAGRNYDGELLLFYTWVTPYAALFFSRRAAAAHVAWVALLLAVGLGLHDVPLRRAVAVWLLTAGTVLIVATLVGAVADIMRRRDRQLWHLATHDVLTGLPNRWQFAERAAQAIALRTSGETVAVLLIDLDRFKVINDTHGHQAGDEMLAMLAPRLRAQVRSDDLVARFGGDEFAILVRRAGRFDGAILADRIAQAWSTPLETTSGLLFTTGCIGIAVAGRAEDTPQRLLRDADSALYRAKAMGPGSFQLYDEQMRDGVEHRLGLEQDLREALPHDQLHLVYQPVIDLSTGEVVSVEALLRWAHPDLGLVPPDQFIPMAEDTGMIIPIGNWVVEQTVAQLAHWRGSQVVGPEFTVAVNVSCVQLREGFAEFVVGVLASHQLPASALVVELTESAIIDARSEMIGEIACLRELGLQLLLDDFGTGYSSLSYLQNIPLHGLKIDRSFIAHMSATSDSPVVEAIITMASTLGLRTVAEGVETPAQRDRLAALGCDFGQGYLFEHPLPATELERYLRTAGPLT